jgi:tRNA pseudouridine55 synthase
MALLRYVVLDKQQGETPLMALTAWKESHRDYKDVPASYAGRLDPMASGKLLILLGEECKQQKSYTKLDKEYEIEVLLDVESDTGDALGIVQYAHNQTHPTRVSVSKALRAERGTHTRPYPHFSSKPVAGKPLFLHALEGGLEAINIPEHAETIYKIELTHLSHLSTEALRGRITDFLTCVPRSDEPSKRLGADFRIDQVRTSWEHVFAAAKHRTFAVVSIRVVCGSGTYMRTLAPRLGEALGTGALALSIRRTRIGTYWWGFWLRSF